MQIERTARELCAAYGMEPDEWISLWPAGRPYRAWEHFEQLAQLVIAWLDAHSRPPS